MNHRYPESVLHYTNATRFLHGLLSAVAMLLTAAHAAAFVPASPLWPREALPSGGYDLSAAFPCVQYEDPAAGLVWASRQPAPGFSPMGAMRMGTMPVTPAALIREAARGTLPGAPYPNPSYSTTAWTRRQPRVLPFWSPPHGPTERMASSAVGAWTAISNANAYPNGVLQPTAPDPLRYLPVYRWGDRP